MQILEDIIEYNTKAKVIERMCVIIERAKMSLADLCENYWTDVSES